MAKNVNHKKFVETVVEILKKEKEILWNSDVTRILDNMTDFFIRNEIFLYPF